MGLSEREQFELLFERHYAAVLGYALRRGHRALAEDVASETFVVAWRRRDDVPPDALPWLYGVARRVLANEKRSELRRERLSIRLQVDTEPPLVTPFPPLGGELLQAIWRLPDREREALMLVAWEDLSPAQAAAAAGCSRVALRGRLYRARRRLAAWLPELGSAPLVTGDRGSGFEVPRDGCSPITDRSRS